MRRLTLGRVIQWGIGVGIVALALLPIFLFYPTPQPVEAQCGSSTSSCKSCHEVQAQDPVNAVGEWHTAHAFGDFCEFCHAGNVQSKVKDDSHVGLVDPLSDVKASCQSCHPDDYTDRAQIYATALGVNLGTGGGATGGSAATDAITDTISGTVSSGGTGGAVVSGATLDLGQVVAPGAMLVDYNALYGGASEPTQAQPLNWGNIIFVVIDLILFGVLGLMVVYREDLVGRFKQLRQMRFEPGMTLNAVMVGSSPTGAATHVPAAPVLISPDLARQNPALARLLPRLAKASPITLAALDQLLDNEQAAEEVLVALTNVDLHLIDEFRSLNQRDRELLIALAHNNE